MRAMLAFPPQWIPNQPYLAPAALVAYLRGEGIEAAQIDFNVRFYRWLLTRARIEDFTRVCEKSASVLKDRIQLALAFSARDYVLENLDEAVRILGEAEAYYDLPRYRKAQIVINRACDLVSAAIFPSRLTYQDFSPAYPIESAEGVRRAIQDEQTNPFLWFYREEALPKLRGESGVALLGITLAANSQIVPGLTLARVVKQKCPHIKVVVGGYIFGRMIHERANFEPLLDWVDFVIVGDGELPLTELIHVLDSGGSLTSVPGLVYRDERGKIRQSNKTYLDWDNFPLPDYSDLDLTQYFLPEPCLPLYSSDGCYYHRCTFCHDSMSDRRYRCRSPERMVENVVALRKRYGARLFTFGDDSVAPAWLSSFCEKLLVRSVDVCWECRARIEPTFDRKLLGRMHEAGCRGLYVGLETASSRLLKLLQKGITLPQAKQMMVDCKSVGIPLYLYMMRQIPGQTAQDTRQTIDFMVKHRDEYSAAAFTPFTLRPESTMSRHPHRFGIARTWRQNDLEFEGLAFEMDESVHASVESDEHLADEIYEAITRIEGEKNHRIHPKGADYIYPDNLPPYEADAFLYRCRLDRTRHKHSPGPIGTKVEKIGPQTQLRRAATIWLHQLGETRWVFDEASGRRHFLSGQAFWILQSLENVVRIEELIKQFAHLHGLPVSNIRETMLTFLMDLMKRGLVERCPEVASFGDEVSQ